MLRVKSILAISLLLSVFAAVGSMDYQSEVDGEKHYCNMVSEGLWPDFNNDIDCSKQKVSKNEG